MPFHRPLLHVDALGHASVPPQHRRANGFSRQAKPHRKLSGLAAPTAGQGSNRTLVGRSFRSAATIGVTSNEFEEPPPAAGTIEPPFLGLGDAESAGIAGPIAATSHGEVVSASTHEDVRVSKPASTSGPSVACGAGMMYSGSMTDLAFAV
jgi:hypothetical protein